MNHTRRSRHPLQFLATLVPLALLASAALHAQFNAGYYSPDRNGRIRQALSISSSGTTYDAGTYPLFPVALPSGAGKQETEAYCNTCHSPRYITMQPALPGDVWAAEVNKMIKTYGASIPDDATQRITLYLRANFAVETRKK